MMDNSNVLKRPVMGNRARKCVLLLAMLAGLAALVIGFLIWKLPGHRTTLLIVLGCVYALLIMLAWLLPRAVYYRDYTYSLSGEGITLWRKDEAVMSLAWAEAEVSLGSYILRGNENNPSVCARALCFTGKGKMRHPPRFPKRALKGAAGELCIAYSKARLREIFLACGGAVAGDVTPDGLRLSASDTEQMTDALNKTCAWAKKKAANDAAKAAVEAKRQTREDARQIRRGAEGRETVPETQGEDAAFSAPAPSPVQEQEAPAVQGSPADMDDLGDDEEFL